MKSVCVIRTIRNTGIAGDIFSFQVNQNFACVISEFVLSGFHCISV